MAGNQSDSTDEAAKKYPDLARIIDRHMRNCTGCPKGHKNIGWTDLDLAMEAGLTDHTIGNYRNGKNPPSKIKFKALLEKGFKIEIIEEIDGVWKISPDYQELFEAAYPDEPLPSPPVDSKNPQHQPIKGAPPAVPDNPPESATLARTPDPAPRVADPFKTFPKLPVALGPRARQVEAAIRQFLADSGQDTPLHQALDLLLSRWVDHDKDQNGGREFAIKTTLVDAYQLITDLAGAIEACNTDHWQQGGARAELAALKRWVERIAKLVFALGWTEVAWAKLVMPDFEKQIHDICDGDLLYAGHNAALARDFELPHSTLIDKWRVKFDPAIDPGIGPDLEKWIYDKAANHFGAGVRPSKKDDEDDKAYEIRLAQWRRKVTICVKVESDIHRRSVSLTAKLANSVDDKAMSELKKFASAIHSNLHAWSGRIGSNLCCAEDLFLHALYALQQRIQQIP